MWLLFSLHFWSWPPNWEPEKPEQKWAQRWCRPSGLWGDPLQLWARCGPSQTPAGLGPLFSAPECYARHSGAWTSPGALGSRLGTARQLPWSRPSLPFVERGQLKVLAKLAHVKHSSGPFPAWCILTMWYGERQTGEEEFLLSFISFIIWVWPLCTAEDGIWRTFDHRNVCHFKRYLVQCLEGSYCC